MNVLIVGGSKGSWAMRGKQLGAAIGARYMVRPRKKDWSWADVVVLVKRAYENHWKQASALQVPVVWDVLDFWMQPRDNDRSEADLVREVEIAAQSFKPSVLIGATKSMAKAIGGVYLPHHSRIGLYAMPPRKDLKVVAYEGNERYLDHWRPKLESACKRMGLSFVVNPADLTQADLLVAFRGGEWDGWACRHWKSGVKFVNAVAAGRPILSQWSDGAREIWPCGGTVEDRTRLEDSIREWMPLSVRVEAYMLSQRRAHEFHIDTIAKQYMDILRSATRAA